MAPPSACGCRNIGHTWTHMSCTCKLFNPEYWYQACASPHIHCQARQITWVSTMEKLGQGHLCPKQEVPPIPQVSSGNRSWAPWWEANTLAKIFSNSVLNSYSEYLHMSPRQFYINNTPVVYSLTHTQLNFFPNIPPILFSKAYTHAAETHTWPYTNI